MTNSTIPTAQTQRIRISIDLTVEKDIVTIKDIQAAAINAINSKMPGETIGVATGKIEACANNVVDVKSCW